MVTAPFPVDLPALQMRSLDAQIAGLEAQVSQAQTDLTRAEDLFGKGIVPKTRLDVGSRLNRV
jgi:multidrug resistance efflux pump